MFFSNGLTAEQTERLAILAEECAEVTQVIGKIIRHGYDSVYPADGKSNRDRLEEELGHIINAKSLLILNNDVNSSRIEHAFKSKQSSIGKWLHQSHILQ